MTDDISRELRAQAAFLKDREPVYERLLALLEEAVHGEFGARLRSLWSKRTFHSTYERPLLLLAALRYDALREGDTHPLHAALAEDLPQVEVVTPEWFAAAISPTRTRVERVLRTRAVQTNETTRAVTWLWPAHLLSSAGERRLVALVDLGTSAGLNLIADDLPALWVDEHGHSLPIEPRPPVALRLGIDVNPLDVRRDDDAMWLRACVWPSDRRRLARLEQAIEAFKARPVADIPLLEARPLGSAAARLDSLPDDTLVLCVQTIVRDYLAPDERKRYEHGMRELLLRRPPRSAVMVELELDPANVKISERSATIIVRFADRRGRLHELLLARTHPHPRQLFTNRKSVEAFTAAFRPT
jgi:hypothetical protein